MSFTLQQCQQCGKVGLELQGGRCSACRHRTPVDVWRDLRQNTPADVRVDAFNAPLQNAPLVSRLLPQEESERLRSATDAFIAAAPVRRIEQISPRCIKQVYSNPRTGKTLMRVDLVLEADEI